MSGSGRKDSGAGSKSRYSSLNLSQNYKSTGNEYKNNPKRGSLQSLGKISTNARRMPAPAQLRSLKSSNDGQDPTVALVPQGGVGWSKEEEKEKEDPLNYTRKVEKPQNTVVPEGFKTNFPSLEEQEKMSKKEKEELERKQREEENYDDEPSDSPPSSRGQQLKKPPKEVGGQESLHYNRGGGPPQPGPHPQGLYHQKRAMYRQPPPPRPPVGRYPHPYHQNPHYRHPYPPVPPHHGGYPPPLPPFVDPYSIPPKDRLSKNNKPMPEVSSKDIDNRLEEEDDGWAGHQEEVDYTKEVVFEDSSDEDSPKKGTQDKADVGREKQGVGHPGKVVPQGEPSSSAERRPVQQQYHSPQGGHPSYPYHHPPHIPPYPTPYPPPPHVAGWFPRYQQQQQHGDSSNPMYEDSVRGRQPQPTRATNVPSQLWGSEQAVEKSDKPSQGKGFRQDSDSPIQYDAISPVDNYLPTPSSPDSTAARNPPKKIMMRDLGDKGESDQYGQRSMGDCGKNTDGDGHKKVAWGCVTAQTTTTTIIEATVYQRHESPVQTVTQPVEEPLSILKERNSSKTLYEPEGRESEEKFRKYQRSTSSGGGASDHHTHSKSKKTSRTDSRGSEGEVGMKSPTDKRPIDDDHEVFEDDKKRVLMKKTGSDDRTKSDSSSRSKGIDKGWKGDNKRDREPRHEDKRRGGGRNERGKDRRDSDTAQQGIVKPHPSHAKRLKSEEGSDEVPQGKDSKSSSSHRTSNNRSLPMNKHYEDNKDLGVGGASNKVKNSTEKHDTRGGGGGAMPRRTPNYEKDPRSERYDRGAPRQSNRHDVKTPHSHSRQSDSHYSGKYQEPSRGSGKPRRDYQNNQNPSSTDNYKGKPTGSKNQSRRREYGNEGTDIVIDKHQQQQSTPVNDNRERYSKQSNDGRSAKSDIKKDTKESSIPPKQDPIPNSRNLIPQDQERVPTSKQDPIIHKRVPISSKQNPIPRKQESSNQTSMQIRQNSSLKHDSGRQDPVPPKHNSMPSHNLMPSEQDSKQDPTSLEQDSIPSKPDPKSVGQNVVLISEDPVPHRSDRSRNIKQAQASFDQKQKFSEVSKSFTCHSTTKETTLPPKHEMEDIHALSERIPDEGFETEQKLLTDKSSQPSSTDITPPEDVQAPTEPKNTGIKSSGSRKPRQDYGNYSEFKQDDRLGNKRRFNTREREDKGRGSRGRGGRWGHNYNDYEDDGSHVPTRKNHKRFEEDDEESYPSRTFDRTRRGGGRGRDHRAGRISRSIWDRNNTGTDVRKSTSKREDTSNDMKEEEESKGGQVYDDLDDIDSPSDWEDDEEDKPSSGDRKKRPQGFDQHKRGGSSSKRYGGGTRSYGERNNRRQEKYYGGHEDTGRGQKHVRKADVEVVEDEAPVQDPPTRDPNFNKYDINAHNVFVVDRRNSRSDGEEHSLSGVGEEGFIQVKSKRDKHKDREDKRKTDGASKKGDDYSNRHKGFPGRGQEQNNGGKGWGHVQKKAESTARDGGNGEWPINEGRSAYGAIGDKPSKEKGSSHDDTHKTTSLSTNHGYKLFETADKGKNAPFGFDPPLSNTPRKGDRLQLAIDITLPPHLSPHFDTERKSSNEQQSSPAVVSTTTTSKNQQLSSSENISSSNNKSRENNTKNIDDKELPHTRASGFRGDSNKQRKPKNDQKLYTPPAARNDDRAQKGQRSQSSKQGNNSSSQPKVHHHDDPRGESMGSIEEDSSHSHHRRSNKKEETVVQDVYLQQHQGLGGGHLTLGGENMSGGNVSEIPLDPTDSEIGQHVLKELSSNKGLNQCNSSTKFGSVSYASALKMKSQVKPLKVDGVVLDETADVANLLSPKLGKHGDSQYTESDCASTEYDSIMHDMLREAVLSHSDENEVDGGSSALRYTPSSPAPRHSEECYSSGIGVSNPTIPSSPSTSFIKPPFSSPVGGGSSLQGSFSKPSPLYSGVSAGGEPSSLGEKCLSSSPSSYSHPPEDQDDSSSGSPPTRGSVKKQLLKEETRPSSAQSLSDSPLVMRFQKTGFSGLESSPSHGGPPAAVTAAAPLTRVASAPSHLPLSAMKHEDEDDDNDDTDSVKTDDSISTNSKSILNIEANEFVPNQITRKKPTHHHHHHGQKGNNTRTTRGSGGSMGYHGNHRNRGGGASHGQNHQKTHNTAPTPHGSKLNQSGGHFQQQHRHAPQQPHPHNQQQSLLNKPPLDVLLQLFFKSVHSGLALPPPTPTIQTSQGIPPHPPSLPLKYSPMSSGIPYQVTHPPGIMTQSRKPSQEGIPPTPPHGMLPPHPPLPSAPPLQYITTGSKVGGTVQPQESGPTEVSIPSGTHHPPYYSVTPLLPNSTPPQLPPAPVILPPPPHPSQVHHLPSTRPSHAVATPINGPPPPPPPQVPPLTIIPSLQLTPRPVMVEQQSNSNSRPPLLPTPPGFNLLHQTSAAAATPTVMTPSIHHPNWPINPQAFRVGMPPPNIPPHDQASIIPFPHAPHIPPTN